MSFESIDAEVVRRLRGGDESAFRMIYDLMSARIYSFAHKFLKNREQSEEIVQETFLQLWTMRNSLDDRYPISVFLYFIARRISLNALRKMANHHAAYKKMFREMTELHNETEELIMLGDLKRATEAALMELPAQQRTAFRLSRLEGLNYDEISKRMDISRNTVKNHLVQAVKNMRIHFTNKDFILMLLAVYFLEL